MSFPAAAVASVTPKIIAAAVNPLDVLMASVNTNPDFIGLMMLLLNLGGRFLSLEISKDQEKFLSQPAVRRFFLFAVLFVATRNIIISLGLTVIVVILLAYLFNENSDLCLWKSCMTPRAKASPQASYVGLTSEEVMIMKRLQDKQAQAQSQQQQTTPAASQEPIQPPSASQVYASGMRSVSMESRN